MAETDNEVLIEQRDRAERRHERLESAVEALGSEPATNYPDDCGCSHGMGFQFHTYPCRFSREVPRSAVRALLNGPLS